MKPARLFKMIARKLDSTDALREYVRTMTEWEIIVAHSYCLKSLEKLPGYEKEIFLIAFEMFNSEEANSIRFLQNLKQIYQNEYSKRHIN